MMTDTTFISLYILFGACFGLITFSQRHLFSEGPHTAKELDGNLFFESRVFWVLLCAMLWPIMTLTRIHTAWLLNKRRKLAQKAVAH
jgi:hypothetical protein